MTKSAAAELPRKAVGWAARDASGTLAPFNFSRRANGDDDVTLKILFCGICHSDLHIARNHFGFAEYPLVPGHEIVGEVIEVGQKVLHLKVGDYAGVGCLVNSCRSCDFCQQDREQCCPNLILTYGSIDKDGTRTHGGYSDMIVVHGHFVVSIPGELSLADAAPLLCAGITVYSPLKQFALTQPGLHLAIVGLGGLGHVAVKFAKAFGAKVTVISTSPQKKAEAIHKLGADAFLFSHDQTQLLAAMGSMDAIIDTVSAVHPMLPLLGLLKPQGKLIMVGVPDKPLELPVLPLVLGNKMVVGSGIGGMKETQEMLDFAAKHGIAADVELIPMDYVNTAMGRLLQADVRYRFVIDIAQSFKTDQQ